MEDPSRRCPATSTGTRRGACPDGVTCGAGTGDEALMPRDGVERAVMLTLRFVAAAAETGDAACWDAAFDRAETEFGPRDGALLVARAGALLRALRRDGAEIRFLPPPCRRLSTGEAALLGTVRARIRGEAGSGTTSQAMRAAFADLVAPILEPRCPAALTAIPPVMQEHRGRALL